MISKEPDAKTRANSKSPPKNVRSTQRLTSQYKTSQKSQKAPHHY